MKKIILIGSVLTVMGLLLAFTIPALAHVSGNGTTTTTNDGVWQDMYEACQNGDWEAMAEAAGQFHGEDYGNMPYHEGYSINPDWDGGTSGESWNETGSHMGDGMMGDGWGGMMGGGMMGW